MPRLGLTSFLVLCLLAPGRVSAQGATKTPPSAKGNAFRVNFFGEGGGDLPAMSPDQSGYYNEASRAAGEENAKDYPDGQTGPIHPLPGLDEPAAGRARNETFTPPSVEAAFPRDVEAARPDRRFEPRGYGDVRRIPRRWPGPSRGRPEEDARASAKPAGSADGEAQEDDFRDAPAAASRYSLWQNLSTPLLLPAAKAGSVGIDEARALGRKDYESHILASGGSRGEVVEAPAGGIPSGFAEEAGDKREGLPVTLEIDREKAGDLRDALAGLSARTGFKMDERFIPSYVGAGKAKVEVRGWVVPERMGEVLASEEVARVEMDRIRAGTERAGRGAETEILVGIRIPPESSPTEALRAAASRLGARAGFVLDRAIGYQRIPQTSKMVLILSGKVPVRNLSRVLGDESVVKVAPAPKKKQLLPPPPPAETTVRLTRNPVIWVLLPMLAVLLLAQALLRKKAAR